jgi:dihydrofolate reductase
LIGCTALPAHMPIESNEESAVRKVVVYEFITLDGVAEDVARYFTEFDDEAVDAFGAATIETQDAVILGRRSYDEWVTFWPTSTIEPFASFINAVPKYVATSTPLEAEWANSTPVDVGGLVDFVRNLKRQAGGDIGVHASIIVAQTLLKAGVVDELRLIVAPAIAGDGRKLFDGLPAIPLSPISGEITKDGFLLLAYRISASND